MTQLPVQVNDNDARLLRLVRLVTAAGAVVLAPAVWLGFAAGVLAGLLTLTLVVPLVLLVAINVTERIVAFFDRRAERDVIDLTASEVAPAA